MVIRPLHARQDSQCGGFTLLELLIGAAVAVVILTALLLLLQSVGSVRESQAERTESVEALRLVHDEISEQLRHLAIGDTNVCDLVALENRLTFCSLLPGGLVGFPEQVLVDYRREENELQQILTRRGGSSTTNVLLNAVDRFSVDAFRDGAWGNPGAELPSLLRVAIALEDGSRQSAAVVIPAATSVESRLERQ